MSSTPNIPGMRRDISTAYPGLVRQYRHFQSTNTRANETNLTSWSQEDSLFHGSSRVLNRPMSCGSIRDEELFSRIGSSLNDSFKNLSTMSLRMQSFPAQADSFSDTSGRYSLRSQQQDRSFNCKALPYSNLDSVPSFVTKEREQLCRVKAYFLEKIPHDDGEQDRARVVEVIFYIEDNTIEIIEPFIPNCGIRHGKKYCWGPNLLPLKHI